MFSPNSDAGTPMSVNGRRAEPPSRILHVILDLKYGGMQQLLLALLSRVDHERFRTEVLVLDSDSPLAARAPASVPVRFAGSQPRTSMLWPRKLIMHVKESAPHILHTHSGTWYKASLAARIARVPAVVYTDHGRRKPDPWLTRFHDRIASRRTDAIVAVSQTVRDQLNRFVARPERLQVILNGIDCDNFKPCEPDGYARRNAGLPPDTPLIGSVGRFAPIKGYDIMVEAYAHLIASWSRPNAPALVMVGGGSEEHALRARASELGLADKTRFLGWRDDVQYLLPMLDVFTLSSRSEGTSLSLLEAMSCGVCPVVTNVGGNSFILGPELSHRLVVPENPRELARAWTNALENADRRNEDGRVARQRVVSEFSLARMVDAYECLYAKLLSATAG